MPNTRRQKVPQARWTDHKETIARLYLAENRSLEGLHGVIELMKQHGLCASKPQYETQFKRWGFRKRLNRESWHVIGHIVERRKLAGQSSHIYVYGTRVSNEKIKKETARYKLCNLGEQSCGRDALPEGVTIESHPPQAENPVMSPKGHEDNISSPSPTASIRIEQQSRERRGLLPDTDCMTLVEDLQEVIVSKQSSTCIADIGSHTHSPSTWSPIQWSLIPSRLPTPSSQFKADVECVVTDLQGCGEILFNDSEWMICPIPANTTSLLAHLEDSLFYEIRSLCRMAFTKINPSICKIMPLLPWKARQELQKSSVDIVVLKQIMFLLMNNFAGSDYAAFDVLFEQVKQFSVSQMEDILDAIPPPYTAALQQSILTIAIKSNVPAIVTILLGRGLDADQVTCRFGSTSFTPLGLACKFRRLDIVVILIGVGVDVNQTDYNTSSTAMWHLLGSDRSTMNDETEFPPVTCDVLQCLLTAGAKIGWLELENPQFWKNKPLLDVYIHHARLPTEFNCGYQLRRPLINAMRLCDFDRTTRAIKTMLGKDFPFLDPEVGNRCLEALQRASYQGNATLVDYFLEAGLKPNTRCLCQAVRGNNQRIVHKYIQAGTNIDCISLLDDLSLNMLRPYAGRFSAEVDPYLLQDTSIRHGRTTPYAEALRWNHPALIRTFEDLGILETITENERFGAALNAAAEAGNTKVVQKLLIMANLAPELIVPTLSMAISFATLGNHEEIVEMLMTAGIQPIPSNITAAILVRNIRLVRLFLDTAVSAVDIAGLLYFAVRWGNEDIIKRLIHAGAPVTEYGWELGVLELHSVVSGSQRSPLGEAIRQGNHDVIQLLLDNGASHYTNNHPPACSPLTDAIDCGNESVARDLLACGVDPNDPEALLAAVSKSIDMTGAVLGAFCRRYPSGDKFFASKALRKAIWDENEVIVRMLANHTNLNDKECERVVPVEGVEFRFPKSREYFPTLLGEAIAVCNVNIVRILLDSGGDPNSTVATTLPYPRRGRWTAISQAICTGDLAMVKLLHDRGADIHFSATLGMTRTSLQLAAELGHADIVHFLLEHGVDVNAPSCIWGAGTALQLAVMTGYGGIAELLIQHGADINAPGSKYQGRTAFEGAAKHGRMDMLLLLYHRGVDIVSDGGKQIRRACEFAEKNGQLAAKGLVEQLAETASLNAILAM